MQTQIIESISPYKYIIDLSNADPDKRIIDLSGSARETIDFSGQDKEDNCIKMIKLIDHRNFRSKQREVIAP